MIRGGRDGGILTAEKLGLMNNIDVVYNDMLGLTQELYVSVVYNYGGDNAPRTFQNSSSP